MKFTVERTADYVVVQADHVSVNMGDLVFHTEECVVAAFVSGSWVAVVKDGAVSEEPKSCLR